MEANELAVFRHFADKVDSMMIGHIAVDGLDTSGLPGSLSPAIIDGLLRNDMGFRGLVMTDDLDMGAILNHYGFDETMRLALTAGNDLLMICHRVATGADALKAVSTVDGTIVDRALANIAAFKQRLTPPAEFSEAEFQRWDQAVWDLRVDTLGAELASQRSPEDGKRSPVEIY
jgi:beta-N-acetylhexosaminidase